MADELSQSIVTDTVTGKKWKVTHPKGDSPENISAAAHQMATYGELSPALLNPIGMDMARSVMAAPRKAVEWMAGLPGTAQHGVNAGLDWALGTTPPKEMPHSLITPADIQAQTSKVLGPSYESQTIPGHLIGGAIEGAVGGAAGAGRMMTKLAIGGISGLGSEAVSLQTEGQPWQTPAAVGGGLLAGLAAILAGKGISSYRGMLEGQSTGRDISKILGNTNNPLPTSLMGSNAVPSSGPDIPAASVRRLARDVEADRLTPQGVQSTLDALGPEARTLDVGRQLKQTGAVGLARIPGQAQSDILDALQSRTGERLPTGDYKQGAASGKRFAVDFDQAFGSPVHDMVKLGKTIEQTWGPRVTKAYDDVMSAHPYVWDEKLKSFLDRDVIKNAYATADKVASNYGRKVSLNDPPSLETWDFVKKGIDQRINKMMKTGDLSGAEVADLGGLLKAKRDLVEHLDAVTNGAYKNARELSMTQKGLEDAADFGAGLFNNKILPEHLKEQFDGLSAAEKTMAKASMRREVDRQMGSVGNDALKARSLFDQGNVKSKVEQILGANSADIIEKRVNAEKSFQGTTDTAAKNSITNLAQNVTEGLKDAPPPNFQSPTLWGALSYFPRKGAEYLHNTMQGTENTRRGMAQILLHPNQGNDISEIVQALLNYNSKVGKIQKTPTGEQAKAVIRGLMSEQIAK